jgi:hypothetical protein
MGCGLAGKPREIVAMNAARNHVAPGTIVRYAAAFIALAVSGGCNRSGPAAPAPAPAPKLFPNPRILQFRILAVMSRDAPVCELAKAQQLKETRLGRPWSAEVYKDDAQTNLMARWYRCDKEFVDSIAGNTDYLLRQLPSRTAPEFEVLALADNFNINRADFQEIRPDLDESGAPCISFGMTEKGAKKLYNLTSARLPTGGHHSYLAILFDETVVSAPRLNEVISDRGMITGKFTRDEVQRLVDLCNITHVAKPRPMPPVGAVGTGFAVSPRAVPLPTPMAPVGTGFAPPPSFARTPTATATPTPKPTSTPTAKPSGLPTLKPEGTGTSKPEGTGTSKPESNGTTKPSGMPSLKPSGMPSLKPQGISPAKPVETSAAKPSATPSVTATPSPTPTASGTKKP